ncbi:unnamed protein product [Linum tenue]|uniref:Uncharacterized protein n=1 Tax=Linum tenue TaxID=586396 RepID=A0AAV0M110_9ROSI|nr:unnamed protein product [Linum tenue]
MSSTLRPRPTSSAKQRQQPTNDHDTDEPATAAVVVPPPPAAPQQSLSQRAISQTLTTTANLANLLPTGTLLAFQLLTPIFTNGGSCDAATRPLTLLLLALLAASCLLASFTDSVGEKKKKVYYGFATWKGMFLFDCPNPEGCGLTEEALGRYRIRFVDWVHAVLSGLVFVSVAMRDRNVVSCFYPVPGREVKAVLGTVPVGIGVMCSLLFVVFPTRRHGIGYPVTAAAASAVATK